MSNQNVWGEVAVLNRMADLIELYDLRDLPQMFRQVAREMEEYYRAEIGQPAVKFDLTKWVESK